MQNSTGSDSSAINIHIGIQKHKHNQRKTIFLLSLALPISRNVLYDCRNNIIIVCNIQQIIVNVNELESLHFNFIAAMISLSYKLLK